MRRGRHRAAPGVAVAALTTVVLVGGGSFAPGAAAADVPQAPPPSKPCTVGGVTFLPPAASAPTPDVKAGPAGQCVDAIKGNILKSADVDRYGLTPVPAASTTPSAPQPTATTAPKPTTPKPAVPKPTTPTPTATPSVPTPTVPKPTAPNPTTSTLPNPTTQPATPKPTTQPAPTTPATPASPVVTPEATALAPSPELPPTSSAVPVGDAGATVNALAAPAPAPAAGPPVASLGQLPPAGGAQSTGDGLVIGDAPSAEPVPVDQVVLAVDPTAYLDPLGAPGTAALPGEGAVLQNLGENTSGVTTSSRVSAFGLDGLHRSGGLPAVLGVMIMSGLSGLALRHRILSRIRAADTSTPGGPDPEGDPASRGRDVP